MYQHKCEGCGEITYSAVSPDEESRVCGNCEPDGTIIVCPINNAVTSCPAIATLRSMLAERERELEALGEQVGHLKRLAEAARS